MGKVLFYCGQYLDIPVGTQVLGSLTATAAEMSAIGKSLEAPAGDNDLCVFSNSDHLANGVRIAIRSGRILPENFSFMFHDGSAHVPVGVGVDGDLKDMLPGFFDQAQYDLLELF